MTFRNRNIARFCGFFFILLTLSIFIQASNSKIIPNQNSGLSEIPFSLESIPNPSAINNFDSVEEILDSILNDYSSSGYYPQIYRPSLQATYYALYILDAIGRIATIDHSKVLGFIMSHYDSNSKIFMDDYSRRYLDIDPSKTYYPYTSLLEVNSYAILSLEILNRLDLINVQDFINFIWSCYNPTTSGFAGQPYDVGLPDHFKLSTMDNTYYAISTLDILMPNWNGYQPEISALIQYIVSLQSTNTFFWYYGGFDNDADVTLDTLSMFEPNLLSAYYSIKSLDMFGSVSSINLDTFYQYLNGLYDGGSSSFQMSHFLLVPNLGNIVGTSLGLSLSDLTSYSGINRNIAIGFLLAYRNSKGIWNYSTDYLYSELIDTFQVVRGLSESDAISQLDGAEKDVISDAIHGFLMNDGFSLLSEDLPTINSLYSLIYTFDKYERLAELNIQYLYSLIEQSSYYYSIVDSEGFLTGVTHDDSYLGYRSFPIEYYYSGNNIYLQEVERSLVSHKNMYMALASLNMTSKLGDFENAHNLNPYISNIIDSQFLDGGYSNYGGLLPFLTVTLGSLDYQNDKIFIEYSYYAIKTLEILVEYLGLGNITGLSFDQNALSTYIHNHIVEDSSNLYFSPEYTTLPDVLMENTYHAIYILKSMGLFDLDEVKIMNFVSNNINYSNIKNVYFAYRISKLLDLAVPLDYNLVNALVGTIYLEEMSGYFLTTDKKRIDQEVLVWVADMVKNDLEFTEISIDLLSLSDCEFLSTGQNITFLINSTYGGAYELQIDGIVANSSDFIAGKNTFVHYLDNYTDVIGERFININATAIGGKEGTLDTSYFVYSDSETMVEILDLDNYEFLSVGNNIRFILGSDFPDWYNFTIDGIEVSSGSYSDDEMFIISIDGYDMGDHPVYIWASGLDGKEGFVSAIFSVFSTSETNIQINSISNYVFGSTGNYVKFKINSDYPEWYNVSINGMLIQEGPYISDEEISCLIDGYSTEVYTLSIWANSTDKKETIQTVQFSVFSESFINIDILSVDNYEFRTTGNIISFLLNCSFPDIYQFAIDGIFISSDVYNHSGEVFNFSIDNYFIGEHNISIWANSTDRKEAMSETSFTVYSLSNTVVNIEEFTDYEFQTDEVYVQFNISSLYPDYYKVIIDGEEVSMSDYENGVHYYYGIDGYEVGLHTLLIWAIGEDGKTGTASMQFNVYSNIITVIHVNEIPSYEFMSTGNNLNFSVNSEYSGSYNVSIDGILIINNGTYSIGEVILIVCDGYNVGNHSVIISVNSMDGTEAYYETIFSVYSTSSTIITIHELNDYELNSTNNFLNFSISSKYPDYFNLWIDNISVSSGNFNSDIFILYSLDNITSILGNHTVYIWAMGLDGKEAEIQTMFTVYPNDSVEGTESSEKKSPNKQPVLPAVFISSLIVVPGTVIGFTYRFQKIKIKSRI